MFYSNTTTVVHMPLQQSGVRWEW